MNLVEISRRLSRATDELQFAAPVTHVYNPLDYARLAHEAFLKKYGRGRKEAIFLGMNPGPFGMAQTGVPFGEIDAARDWLGIEEPLVACPWPEHPKRKVLGFDCPRSEVSGRRIWGWARERFGSPEAFFERFYVANYCPLVFLEESGKNRTPNNLKASERKRLYEVCDAALRQTVEMLEPDFVIGIGTFAEDRARAALGDGGPRFGRILHPSPANPAANRGWSEAAERELGVLGIVVG